MSLFSLCCLNFRLALEKHDFEIDLFEKTIAEVTFINLHLLFALNFVFFKGCQTMHFDD